MKMIIVLITGAAIFAWLTISRIFLNRISLKYRRWKKVRKIFPLAESIVWTAFIFWGTGQLFGDKTYYPYLVGGMVLIVMGLATRYLILDVVTGSIYKMQNELKQGETIKIGNMAGHIKAVRLTHLEMTSENGQHIKIPYSRLNRELIVRTATPEGMEEFTISMPFDKRFSKQEVEERIKYELANSPWCNFKAPPVIRLREEEEEKYTYDLLIYAMNQKHLRMVEQQLKKRLGDCLG